MTRTAVAGDWNALQAARAESAGTALQMAEVAAAGEPAAKPAVVSVGSTR